MSWIINERLDVERQVVGNLCREIARGAWSPGDCLPAPNALAQEHILNPRIVESAFSLLAQAGLLGVTSDGDYVVAQDAADLARTHLLESAKEEMRDLVNLLRSAGIQAEDIERTWGGSHR